MNFQPNVRLTEAARLAAIRAVQTWIPLEKSFPEPGQAVLVKMEDNVIEVGHWDSARASWTHNPFERWGRPEFWAPLPTDVPPTPSGPREGHPISGTTPSRVRPEPGPALFPFKFLSSFLQ